MRVYLIGPVSNFEDLNRDYFEDMRLYVRSVFNGDDDAVTIPHDIIPADYNHSDAMRLSLVHMLTWAELVVALDGWRGSSGAALEADVARNAGIEFLTIDDFIDMYDWRIERSEHGA